MNGARKSSATAELFNACTHLVGLLMMLAISWVLIWFGYTKNWENAFGVTFFTVGMLLMYLASVTYHFWKPGTKGKLILRKLDHISIYILIASSYTPICMQLVEDNMLLRMGQFRHHLVPGHPWHLLQDLLVVAVPTSLHHPLSHSRLVHPLLHRTRPTFTHHTLLVINNSRRHNLHLRHLLFCQRPHTPLLSRHLAHLCHLGHPLSLGRRLRHGLAMGKRALGQLTFPCY